MEWIVLGLLIFKDMTIYELNSAFKMGLSLIYSASYGNLQYSVKKLLKDDLISFKELVENGRNKKIYHINESGTKAFYEWMSADIPLNKLETIMLSKVYFLGLIKDKATRVSIVQAMITGVEQVEYGLRQMESELKNINLPDDIKEVARFQFKTLDYGIMAHSSGKAWLTDLLQAIEQE